MEGDCSVMKIRDERHVEVRDLTNGELFELDGDIYMKIDSIYTYPYFDDLIMKEYNVFSFTFNNFKFLSKETKVRAVEAELVIKR